MKGEVCPTHLARLMKLKMGLKQHNLLIFNVLKEEVKSCDHPSEAILKCVQYIKW